MDNDTLQFHKMTGFGILKVLPEEVRYDPLIGKPAPIHWVVKRADIRNVSCESKPAGLYMLLLHTDQQTYVVSPLSEEAVLAVAMLVQPDKLQSEPSLVRLQQLRADEAAKRAQAEQQKQLDAQMKARGKAARHAQAAYQWQMAAHLKSQEPQQLVRVYHHDPENEFRKDSRRLAQRGWVVQSQTAGGLKHEGLGSIVTFGVFGKRRVGEMTVVYTRPRTPVPEPMPPQLFAAAPAPSAADGRPSAQPQGGTQATSTAMDAPFAQLEKLADLHQKGIVSDAEYAAKKSEILARV